MIIDCEIVSRELKRDIKSGKFFTCYGFSFIGLMLFIAITGLCLSVAGLSWRYEVRSQKEQQLLFVGGQFRAAINSYYADTPGKLKVYPSSLKDLLIDKRMPNLKRHLREIYTDPMTGRTDWGFVIQQGHIVGIFSSSSLAPLKHNGFRNIDAKFTGAKSYQEWIFGQSEGVKSFAK